MKRRKPKPKPKSRNAKLAELHALIRHAAKSGAAEAIEHCSNFWTVSDGYKKYIEHQITLQSEALMAAVRVALRDELARKPRKR